MLAKAKRERIEREAYDFEALKRRPKIWRIKHLYYVLDRYQQCVKFEPYPVQLDYMANMHSRDVILKARKRGFSTFIQIWMLDEALFTDFFRGLVIAQDKDKAQEIFRDKLRFAYDRLPASVLAKRPLNTDSKSEMEFPNGSVIKVSISGRGGTPNFVHVSELGKIAAQFPHKAKEILTGTFPAVATGGHIVVESTAEGQEGAFFTLVGEAQKLRDSGAKLTPLDFKLHFYSWWDEDDYQIDPAGVVIEPKDHEYFDKLEHEIGRKISLERRAWYVKTRSSSFGGSQELMWQEHPSTEKEAFQVSTEGTYYHEQLAAARKQKRICSVPYNPAYPVYTFWDIGGNDETAIWCIQVYRGSYGVINYKEASGEPFGYFVNWLKSLEYTWATQFLPHDADAKRQQGESLKSAKDMLQELAPGWRFVIVPRIPVTVVGIQQTRNVFPLCVFDEERCAEGLRHLELYKKEWDKTRACWKDEPRHDVHSNGADAFRQFGQAVANGQVSTFSGGGGYYEPEAVEDY